MGESWKSSFDSAHEHDRVWLLSVRPLETAVLEDVCHGELAAHAMFVCCVESHAVVGAKRGGFRPCLVSGLR